MPRTLCECNSEFCFASAHEDGSLRGMIGTLVDAAAIVTGGVVGLKTKVNITPRRQHWIKLILALFTIYAGLSMTWSGLNGPFLHLLKQLGIMFLALILGNLIGRLLHLQKGLNKLGRYAGQKWSSSTPGQMSNFNEGFITCTILYCVGPMAILGAIQDGLTGSFKTLGVKAVMDGLATFGFSKRFGWGVILSALPVLAYQGTITIAAHYLAPFLQDHELLDSVSLVGGILIFCISLIILEVKKVPLADYLPALVVAPLLTAWWR